MPTRKTCLQWIYLALVVACWTSAPPVLAEKPTELEMANVAQNWLTYNLRLQGAWAGASEPTIGGSRPILAEGRLVGHSFSVEPRGHIMVPILKEMPPVKS